MTKNQENNLKDNDLGFGTKASHGRLVNKDGTYRVTRTGFTAWHPYQTLVEMSWTKFSLVTLVYYVLLNALFAVLFTFLCPTALSGEHFDSFWPNFSKAYFFSIQTSTTVGYGGVVPLSFLANVLASALALIGLMTFALATGLLFARFSKPVAMILYSKNVLIAPYQDGTSLQIRIVNARKSQLMDLEAQISLSWIENVDGIERRRFQTLHLERHKIFAFPLNWNLVHPIVEGSPLYQKSHEEMKRLSMELVVFVKGFDVVFNQNVHSGSSYVADEFVWNAAFAPMYDATPEEGVVLNMDKIDDYNMLS